MTTHDKTILPIIGAFIIAIAPQISNLKPWIVVWCVLLWGYMVITVWQGWAGPSRVARFILTVAGLFGLAISYGKILGGGAFIGLLAIMAGLKPLETKTHRDKMVAVFIAYFIVITSLFESETLAITLYMFVSVLISTAVLIHVNNPSGKLTVNIKQSAKIMLQAIPLMVLLFFLFPRFQGSLWGLARQRTAYTGMNDSLNMGDISKLVKDDQTAFRAEFFGKLPRVDQRYWRGIIFYRCEGARWHMGFRAPQLNQAVQSSEAYEYNVIIEPHSKKWLFALDVPSHAPQGTVLLEDYSIRIPYRLRYKKRFKLRSGTMVNTGPMKPWERIALKLPARGNENARELARSWKFMFETDEEIIQAALNYFKENNFLYTLNPPLLDRNPIDDFLFNKKKGYCEHFASAFGYLMRAAGIPARIVGGYLGGKENPYGNYILVRQSDAHVWVEVWLKGKGWTRVDPTYAVAPSRIEQGVELAVSEEELPGFLSAHRRGYLSIIRENIQNRWEAINAKWDSFFIGYSYDDQKSLLSRFGIHLGTLKGKLKILLAICALVFFSGLIISIRLFRRPKHTQKDRIQRLYSRFCAKLEKAGFPKAHHLGPRDYAKEIEKKKPGLKGRVGEIIDLYIILRYTRRKSEPYFRKYKILVKSFNPNKYR
jgi:transglutaminase-like putative cysteine protease